MSEDAKNTECLVIGATGLVGQSLGVLLTKKKIKWAGTYNKRQRPKSGLLKLDITKPGEVNDFFLKLSPKVVFHCANLAGGVNFCETNPERAADFHLNATKYIGMRCKALNAKFVYISTDYIFDGNKDSYKEEDTPHPLNVYGKLKLESEQWIKQNLNAYLVIRTTNVYGWDPETVTPNYVMGLYRSLEEKKSFDAPSYLYGNPTYAGDLAEAILELYMKKAVGVFHIVGKSFVNRYEWAKKACEIFGFNGSTVNEIKEPAPCMVPRPMKSRLNIDKFRRGFQTSLHDLESGLKLMKSDMEK